MIPCAKKPLRWGSAVIENLPAQFMNYVLVDRPDGTQDKVPVGRDGRNANAHDPANWMTFEEAKAGGHVAFVLTKDDPYFFLDLDKCRLPSGEWTPQATAIFTSFAGAMGEISISGTGLHILGKCDPAQLQHKRNKFDGWLEFYTQERFIAFGTGGWEPIGGTARPDTDWTGQLQKWVPDRPIMEALPDEVDPTYTGPADDDELITKMLASAGGVGVAFKGRATIKQLWEADPALCEIFPAYDGNATHFDHSSADAALMAHLAYWTGRDMPRMERLFRRSALMRPKFERDDYRTKTIHDAARMCKNVYDWVKPDRLASLTAPEVYLRTDQMIDYFAGCTYITSMHRVLTAKGTLLKPEQFKSTFGGHIFQMQPDGTAPEKNAFIAFTENRAHRFPKVSSAEFDPGRPFASIVDDKINTFFPVIVDMRQGDITPFFDYLFRLMPDENDRAIILAWMAAVVQYPHKKFQWAPVLQGTEGNGKTFLMNCVAYAIGQQFTHRPNTREITDKFNGWSERALLVIVEEIYMAGRRDIMDDLKPKITNEFLPVRRMQETEDMMRSFSKWAFCTNFMDAVIKSRNDRRYAIFFTAQQSYDDIVRDGMDGLYFPNLYDWAKNGGYAAMAYFLMNYPIPDHLNPAGAMHRAPMTSATNLAIQKSIGIIETEVLEACADGTTGFKGGWISMWALDELLRRRRLNLSLNKRSEMLEDLGYIRCPGLPGGRAPSPLALEGGRKPIIYCHRDMRLGDDPFKQYMIAQNYVAG